MGRGGNRVAGRSLVKQCSVVEPTENKGTSGNEKEGR